MQSLARVNPNSVTHWGDTDCMGRRPTIAVKIAHCISRWAEIETYLGAFLAFILHADERAALAMYSSLENRKAQLRLISAAAEAMLEPTHSDIVSTLMTNIIRPVMKERDKLAHWTWGYSDDLPDALLLAPPKETLQTLMVAVKRGKTEGNAGVPSTYENTWVVRENDLDRMLARSFWAKDLLRLGMATVWVLNTSEERAEHLQQLSNEPQIQEGLARLHKGRQKNQATHSQCSESERPEEA
jgi:hypothetical protein